MKSEKAKANQKAWDARNIDKVRAYKAKYRASHPRPPLTEEQKAKYRLYFLSHYPANREKAIARSRAWREANREKHRADVRLWRLSNPDKVKKSSDKYHATEKGHLRAQEYSTARRLLLSRQAPRWNDATKCLEIRALARRLTTETGTHHAVDHIIPINHPLVCGLHVHYNLQILTRSENAKKHNKFVPTQETHS